jgi:hypothetical protein
MLYNNESLIHKIYNLPQLVKLNNYRCFDSIFSKLPNNFQNGIKRFYFKNKTLYVIVKHPTIKMELNYTGKDEINEILKEEQLCLYIKRNLKNIEVSLI